MPNILSAPSPRLLRGTGRGVALEFDNWAPPQLGTAYAVTDHGDSFDLIAKHHTERIKRTVFVFGESDIIPETSKRAVCG